MILPLAAYEGLEGLVNNRAERDIPPRNCGTDPKGDAGGRRQPPNAVKLHPPAPQKSAQK